MNSAVIAVEIHPVEKEVAVQLSIPSRAAINRALNRQKQKIGQMENDVTLNCSDKKLEVSQKYQDFCLHDSGTDDREQILVFGECDDVSITYSQRSLVVRRNIQHLPIAILSA